MKLGIRLITVFFFLAGCVSLIYLSSENSRLSVELRELEAESGRMPIKDPDRVHIAAIEAPFVPPEIAPHCLRVFQFRCYLPPGYDYLALSGTGRVAKHGLYHIGGTGMDWNQTSPDAIHSFLTVSFQKKEERMQVFVNGLSGSTTSEWRELDPDRFDLMTIQKLVSVQSGPRSFSQDTILPLLKIHDPDTAAEQKVAGRAGTTYAGGLFVICPKSREKDLNQLILGETPANFAPGSIAKEVSDE